jgi:hypothetical protein
MAMVIIHLLYEQAPPAMDSVKMSRRSDSPPCQFLAEAAIRDIARPIHRNLVRSIKAGPKFTAT